MTIQSLDSHIEITPGVCGGKPRIAGHRITVQNIAIWHCRLAMSVEEIAAEYNLGLADIYAALAYYHDHREQIDDTIEQERQFVEEMQRNSTSKVLEKFESLKRNAENS